MVLVHASCETSLHNGLVRRQQASLLTNALIKRGRYYILVAACVLARKSEWLRNACLAAALIFPAVAAFHGITLAALHVDGE